MPRYKVKVEYALAFDIDLEVEARNREAAIKVTRIATENAAIWDAIRGQFADYRPEYVDGDLDVTDVRIARTLRPSADAAA